MAPDKDGDKEGNAAREEFEVAYYTKELGRPLQRKLLQRRFDEIGEGRSVSAAASARGEDAERDRHDNKSSREDRAD